MNSLIELPKRINPTLTNLINQYNHIHDDSKEFHLKRLFLLQKIDHFLEKGILNPRLSTWYTLHEKSVKNNIRSMNFTAFEAHLQYYGIQRDAAPLLKAIQFAHAVKYLNREKVEIKKSWFLSIFFAKVFHFIIVFFINPIKIFFSLEKQNDPIFNKQDISQKMPEYAPHFRSTFYSHLQSRDMIFEDNNLQETEESLLEQYKKVSCDIIDHYEKDLFLQEKLIRLEHFLSLSYAKMDAIRGLSKQSLDIYHTQSLGDHKGNNSNFIFDINNELEKENLVIRVEKRSNLGADPILLKNLVSEYFSEDYATFMTYFNIDGINQLRPVVFSEYAKDGSLADYAKRINEDISKKMVPIFTTIADFCIKLMSASYYHPDIKLSNFLKNEDRIFISDRKALTKEQRLSVDQLETSLAYAPPNVKACFSNLSEEGSVIINKQLAKSTVVSLPSYMSFQVGMALKHFMLGDNQSRLFSTWMSYLEPSSSYKDIDYNVSVLIQELTRECEEDRLSMIHFQSLLSQVHLSTHFFIKSLETLSPREKLSNHADITGIISIITSDKLIDDDEIKGIYLQIKQDDLIKLCHDPRVDLYRSLSKKTEKYYY